MSGSSSTCVYLLLKFYFTHTKYCKVGDNLCFLSIYSKDCLREEEREVNQHGRVRKIGDESENDKDNGIEVMKNNWVGNTGQLELDLISRREDVQVCFYSVVLHRTMQC